MINKNNLLIVAGSAVLLVGTIFSAARIPVKTNKVDVVHRHRVTRHSHKLKIQRDSVSAHTVHLNIANAKSLQRLKGIGEKRAVAIVSYRTQNGPFANLEDLKNVPGVGAKGQAKIAKDNPQALEL